MTVRARRRLGLARAAAALGALLVFGGFWSRWLCFAGGVTLAVAYLVADWVADGMIGVMDEMRS